MGSWLREMLGSNEVGVPSLEADDPLRARRLLSDSTTPRGVAALSCVGVSKVFPILAGGASWRIAFGMPPNGKKVVALKDVSLTVPKGTIVGILGRNGAGKSTLLRILAGVYSVSSGRVWREGAVSGLFELGGIGHRFMTGREYTRRALLLQGAQVSQLSALLDDVHEFSELEVAFDAPIYTYSTGMTARLYFASATAVQHDIYLIDEILTVGDEHFRNKCWVRMRDRLSRGASGILVTHDWSAVLKLCEVCHVLDRGRIVESGPSDRIVRSYLGLVKPDPRTVRFSPDNPMTYTAQSLRDTDFRFCIELAEQVSVALGYSIETLRLGVGWEILLLADNLPVCAEIGRNEVELRIPRLPLSAGRYYLNLFLTSRELQGDLGPVQCGDVRGWTYGNPIELTVEGASRDSSTILPVVWERKEPA